MTVMNSTQQLSTGSSESANLRIQGGIPLQGEVYVGGSKNLTLPALAAALLTDEPCVFDQVPAIEDTRTMLRLLKALGATITPNPDEATFWSTLKTNSRVTVHCREITTTDVPDQLARAMRASFLVVGPLLARAGRAVAPMPGGDDIGARPLDVAIRGFCGMGAKVEDRTATTVSLACDRLSGRSLYLDYPSHTGSENLLMAATLASGTTTIINCAVEPEVIAFGRMLNRMGANIQGLGSPFVTVEGVSRLRGAYERLLPDRLVAGTYAIAALVTRGNLLIRNVRADDMVPVTQKLREAGATVLVDRDEASMIVQAPDRLRPIDVQALPFPGFPTDQQAVIAVLLTQAHGVSQIHERVFEDRLRYVADLKRMGAKIEIDPLGVRATIHGPTQLTGATVTAHDIRAGAAMVLAGLSADGTTTIGGVHHLERGYEALVPTLRSIGADIDDAPSSVADGDADGAS